MVGLFSEQCYLRRLVRPTGLGCLKLKHDRSGGILPPSEWPDSSQLGGADEGSKERLTGVCMAAGIHHYIVGFRRQEVGRTERRNQLPIGDKFSTPRCSGRQYQPNEFFSSSRRNGAAWWACFQGNVISAAWSGLPPLGCLKLKHDRSGGILPPSEWPDSSQLGGADEGSKERLTGVCMAAGIHQCIVGFRRQEVGRTER